MSETIDFNDLQRRMDGAVKAFNSDLQSLRTGRASASILEPLTVEAYGSEMPLNQVATISVPEPRMLAVNVWDKSMTAAVERVIRDSGLGLNPITDGNNLRIPLPELNEERRKELAKLAHSYAENAKIAARHVRKDGMDQIKKAEKDSEISEDDSRVFSDRVQKMTDDIVAEIDLLLADKEEEIMQV